MSTVIGTLLRPRKTFPELANTLVRKDFILTFQAKVKALEPALSNQWTIISSMFVIGMVASFDTYLTLKYAPTLHFLERNPLGRWLMSLDVGPVCDLQQIAAFVTAKFIGTLLVMLIIQIISHWRVHLAGIISVAVAIFQLGLAYHLIFALH